LIDLFRTDSAVGPPAFDPALPMAAKLGLKIGQVALAFPDGCDPLQLPPRALH
jgi:hypothetical protein